MAKAGYFIDEYTEFRILEPAIPATTPSAPNRARLLLTSLALSTGLAIGLVLLAEQFDTSVHTVAVTMTRFLLLGLLVTLQVSIFLAVVMVGYGRPLSWYNQDDETAVLAERLNTLRASQRPSLSRRSIDFGWPLRFWG